jgi:type I restriction enzyme S subunit
MAEELYREWFVRLRFPGYEKVKIIKGVPEGWEVKKISEIVDFLSGYSFKSGTYLPSGKHGIVTIKNVQDGFFVPECSDFIDVTPSNMKDHCFLEVGDVLMSLTGNVGRVCHVIGNNYLLNQRVAKLQPKIKQATQFIYYTFKNRTMLQLIENLSLGSTAQMNLSPIQLGKQNVITPDKVLLEKYETATLSLRKEILAILQKNALLKQLRDRLLTRLMSGKIDVENMNIQFPASMQEELVHA